MNISIVGAGSWGTAMAGILAAKGLNIDLWARNSILAAELTQTRMNSRYLPGILLSENVNVGVDLGETLRGADVVVIATPSHAVRNILNEAKEFLDGKVPVVSLTKGIEVNSGFRMSEVFEDVLKIDKSLVAVLSGPNHAEEVSRKIPTASVISSVDEELNKRLQSVFMTNEFRVYANTDPVGVEIAGALKNVIAIAAGISDGLGFGDNTKASLITRGMAEISRFGQYYGAQPATFWGLAGIGDLIATCTSKHSRNRLFGHRIGAGESVDQIRSSMDMVAEGVLSAKAVNNLSQKSDIEMPICDQVYEVLYEGKSPGASVNDLMARGATRE